MWLKMEGHRKGYEKLVDLVNKATDAEYQNALKYYQNNEDAIRQLKFAKEFSPQLREKSLIGWDYIRIVNVAGTCYAAGYLSEEEAWEEIMAAAKMLQKTFSSWEDLGNNYVLGSYYWGSSKTYSDRLQAYKWLLTSSESPWKKYKWNLSLESKF